MENRGHNRSKQKNSKAEQSVEERKGSGHERKGSRRQRKGEKRTGQERREGVGLEMADDPIPASNFGMFLAVRRTFFIKCVLRCALSSVGSWHCWQSTSNKCEEESKLAGDM